MRYVAAYLLATLGGNKNPSASDIEVILSSVGIEADSECLGKVIKELNGKDIDEVIAAGREKLACIPTGGGGVAAPTGGAAAGGGAGDSGDKAEEKKEEKKEEEEEESDDDMGFGLFD